MWDKVFPRVRSVHFPVLNEICKTRRAVFFTGTTSAFLTSIVRILSGGGAVDSAGIVKTGVVGDTATEILAAATGQRGLVRLVLLVVSVIVFECWIT